MNRKIYILLVILCILGLFFFQDTLDTNDKEHLVLNDIKKEDIVIQKNDELVKKKQAAELNSNTSRDGDELIYKSLNFDDKKFYSLICFEKIETENGLTFYPYTSEDLLNQFIEKQELAGLTPTQKQLSMIKSFHKKCSRLSAFTEDIQKDFVGNPFQDENGIGLLEVKLNNLWNEKNFSEVIDVATKHLMSPIQTERMDALLFLEQRMNWPHAINDELNIQLHPTESRNFFNTAINMLQCEYGVVDCGVNSIMMYNYCSFIAESCGMNGYDFLRSMSSDFDMIFINKYIEYLISLGIL